MNIMRSPNEQAEVEALWKEEELKQLSQLDLAKEIAASRDSARYQNYTLFPDEIHSFSMNLPMNTTNFLFNWACFPIQFSYSTGQFSYSTGLIRSPNT